VFPASFFGACRLFCNRIPSILKAARRQGRRISALRHDSGVPSEKSGAKHPPARCLPWEQAGAPYKTREGQMSKILAVVAAMALAVAADAVFADGYPSRSVTLIVP